MTNFVYFIKPVGMDGPIKIGCSDVPQRRLQQIMYWSPFELEMIVKVPGDRTLERNLHDCFADVHRHCEWFHPSDRLLAGIEALKAGKSIAEAFDLSRRTGSIELRGRQRGPAKAKTAVEGEINRALSEPERAA